MILCLKTEIYKIHKVKRVKEENSFANKFFYLSEDLEPFFTQKYGVSCRHKATDISDNNVSNHCKDEYAVGEEWIQCPVCTQCYHEKCFSKCGPSLLVTSLI